jgi:hypothetical protein
VVLDAVDLVGQATVPVATFVLGAVLGGVGLRLRGQVADLVRVFAVKFALLPALVVAGLAVVGAEASNPLLARFLVLEAAAAPAAGLILQVRAYGGDEDRVGGVMLMCYAACLLTLPGWLAVWELVVAAPEPACLATFLPRAAMHRPQRRLLSAGCSTDCRVRLRAPRVENTTGDGTSRPSRRNVVRHAGWDRRDGYQPSPSTLNAAQ